MLKQTLLNYLNQHQSDCFIRQWFEPLCISAAPGKQEQCITNSDNPEVKNAKNEDQTLAGQIIRVTFPHRLFGECFLIQVKTVFEQAVVSCFGLNTDIEYIYKQTVPANTSRAMLLQNQAAEVSDDKGPFSFARFIGSKENSFALETAQGIAMGRLSPDISNPFCLYGASGCGKTHLLSAMANALYERRHAVFMTTPRELNDIYQNSSSNYLARRMILANQALILDDLQQIADRSALQNELVILFDHFHLQGRIVAFGMNCQPEQLEGLIFPLQSRLQLGVAAELKEPDLEVRASFVRKRCEQRGIKISEKQVLNMAAQFTSLRRLEGLINRCMALSYTKGRSLSELDFENMIRQAGGVSLSEVSSQTIISICSEQLNVPLTSIIGSERSREISRARQLSMYLCRELLGFSYHELGNIFGGKDQSTAMYSIKKIEQIIRVNKDMHNLVSNLKAKCLGLKL